MSAGGQFGNRYRTPDYRITARYRDELWNVEVDDVAQEEEGLMDAEIGDVHVPVLIRLNVKLHLTGTEDERRCLFV